MKRRQFIELSAGVIPFLQMHSLLTQTGCAIHKTEERTHLIKELVLLTQTPPEELRKFYCETIGFPLIQISSTSLKIQTGKTIIHFRLVDKTTTRPFYHFAFNIPENKIQSAFEWQRTMTPIVHPNPSGPRDEITHFPNWDAHSVFFIDPAGNLVEYIARHTLNNSAPGGFSINDILYASEIGFIVEDVAASGNDLQKGLKVSEYKPMTNNFWPIGDEYGLLLMINKGREWSSRPDQKNITDVFKTVVTIQSGRQQKFSFNDYPYEISAG